MELDHKTSYQSEKLSSQLGCWTTGVYTVVYTREILLWSTRLSHTNHAVFNCRKSGQSFIKKTYFLVKKMMRHSCLTQWSLSWHSWWRNSNACPTLGGRNDITLEFLPQSHRLCHWKSWTLMRPPLTTTL